MAEEVMAYCVKEKAQRPMKDAHEVELKNGKRALQGVCAQCGTKMTKFISAKKTSAPATSPGAGSGGSSGMPAGSSEMTPPSNTPTTRI